MAGALLFPGNFGQDDGQKQVLETNLKVADVLVEGEVAKVHRAAEGDERQRLVEQPPLGHVSERQPLVTPDRAHGAEFEQAHRGQTGHPDQVLHLRTCDKDISRYADLAE